MNPVKIESGIYRFRDLANEYLNDIPVAGYKWEKPNPLPGSDTISYYAGHWSTPAKHDNAEALYAESDVVKIIQAGIDAAYELKELLALINGECPSLFNEDSGANPYTELNARNAMETAFVVCQGDMWNKLKDPKWRKLVS